MARTTSLLVQALLRGDWDGRTPLGPYIDAATSIVDGVEGCAVTRDKTLTAIQLELIERWLAAHAYAMLDQTYASKSTGGASASFHGQTGLSLDGTKYGQMAQSLDPSGCLTAIAGANRKTARMTWLGKPPSQQTDYRDRD